MAEHSSKHSHKDALNETSVSSLFFTTNTKLWYFFIPGISEETFEVIKEQIDATSKFHF